MSDTTVLGIGRKGMNKWDENTHNADIYIWEVEKGMIY